MGVPLQSLRMLSSLCRSLMRATRMTQHRKLLPSQPRLGRISEGAGSKAWTLSGDEIRSASSNQCIGVDAASSGNGASAILTSAAACSYLPREFDVQAMTQPLQPRDVNDHATRMNRVLSFVGNGPQQKGQLLVVF